MAFFGDFAESSDPAGAAAADPLQYIKDSLPVPTRACSVHVQGAWTALFKFFIGQPGEPGIFHKEIFRAVDSFGHMDTALRRILEIVAPSHMSPTSTVVFRFPLAPIAGDEASVRSVRSKSATLDSLAQRRNGVALCPDRLRGPSQVETILRVDDRAPGSVSLDMTEWTERTLAK
jgi:hypothetical protein